MKYQVYENLKSFKCYPTSFSLLLSKLRRNNNIKGAVRHPIFCLDGMETYSSVRNS